MPPAKKTIGLREVRVGLFVIIAAVVLILLILNASGDISFRSKRHFKAKFASAEGLRPGAFTEFDGLHPGDFSPRAQVSSESAASTNSATRASSARRPV